MIWFTSDTHYGHKNIIEYCERPFANVHEMEQVLIERWNKRVKPDDEVYHLGDVAFQKASDISVILSKLNGKKYLILGNHDQQAKKAEGWEWIKTGVDIRIDGYVIRLCHYPDEHWSPYHKKTFYLHGHSHGSRPYTKHQIDIGVDCTNFYPVNFEMVLHAASNN